MKHTDVTADERVTRRRGGHDPESVRRRMARAVTEVFAPAPVAIAILAAVAWRSAGSTDEALRWGFVAILFAPTIPFAYLLKQVRSKRVTDHHVYHREQRPKILLVGIASVIVAITLMVLLNAPTELTATVGSGGVGLLVALAITFFCKISIHVGVVAGVIVVLAFVFGPPMLFLFPLVAVVGWARVEVRDHTAAQVLGGAVIGAIVTAASFTALTILLG